MTTVTSGSDHREYPVPPLVPAARTPRARQKRRRLLVVGCLLLGAIGFLIFKGLTSAIVYFKTANEAIAQHASLGNSTFQIEGKVVSHSLQKVDASQVKFSIYANGVTVAVTNQGTPPELFQANIPVVLVGHFLGSSNVFSSDEILVKHSNQYIAAHPSRVRAPNGAVH